MVTLKIQLCHAHKNPTATAFPSTYETLPPMKPYFAQAPVCAPPLLFFFLWLWFYSFFYYLCMMLCRVWKLLLFWATWRVTDSKRANWIPIYWALIENKWLFKPTNFNRPCFFSRFPFSLISANLVPRFSLCLFFKLASLLLPNSTIPIRTKFRNWKRRWKQRSTLFWLHVLHTHTHTASRFASMRLRFT